MSVTVDFKTEKITHPARIRNNYFFRPEEKTGIFHSFFMNFQRVETDAAAFYIQTAKDAGAWLFNGFQTGIRNFMNNSG